MPATARRRYAPRDAALRTLSEDALDPAFVAAARAPDGSPARRAVLRAEGPGVYSFPLFRPAFCEALRLEVHRFEHWAAHHAAPVTRPNSMNRYGVVLEELGLEPLLDALLEDWTVPLARELFPAFAGATLDHHHGFVVEYAPDGDRELALHTDDSEVTLNACLGTAFEGGALYFRGLRCGGHAGTPARPEECFEYAHAPGRAVIHAGAHRHGAAPLTAGSRTNVILWCRSTRYDRRRTPTRACAPWCGAAHAA